MQIRFSNRDPLEVPISLWTAWGLKDGLILTEEDMEHLSRDAEIQSWRSVALRYLSHRPRTAQETTRYLAGKGAEDDVVAGVVQLCSEERWINDGHYAEEFVRTRKGLSRREAEWKLSQRGVSSENIEMALRSNWSNETEIQSGLEVARKYVRNHPRLTPELLREKLWGYLHRKGFNVEACRGAVQWAVGELESIAHTEFLDND